MNVPPIAGLRLLGAGVLLFSVAAAADEHGWQANRLMQPTAAQLEAEARGKVVIYDGLDMRQVNVALDRHFERIQNMMFVRIHHLPPSGAGGGGKGEAEVEEDGCD